jgi:hypothetical protein
MKISRFDPDSTRGYVVFLLALASIATAAGQSPSWQDFESLLGKPIMSQEVQQFVKTNHLKQYQTWTNGTGVCENLTNVPFTLFYKSNTVQMVSVTDDLPHYAKYNGKMAHDLVPGDTPESVIRRLGAPSRQETRYWIGVRYDSLRLELAFDLKSRRLTSLNLCYE